MKRSTMTHYNLKIKQVHFFNNSLAKSLFVFLAEIFGHSLYFSLAPLRLLACTSHSHYVPQHSLVSLYFVVALRQVWTFCDNDPNNPDTLHNDEAPNIHNDLCNGRSAWEVMRDHEDFKDGRYARVRMRAHARVRAHKYIIYYISSCMYMLIGNVM